MAAAMTRSPAALRTAHDLVAAGLVSPDDEAAVAAVGQRYAVALTPLVADLIDRTDANDPIARQFVPSAAELFRLPEERDDPIGDHANSPVKGLVHRYPDRVLLKIVGVCPVYCRFCFRREMVGPDAEANLTGDEVAAALAYVKDHPEIWELILTGGDPFVLSPRRVAELMAALDDVAHVKIVRWHTRVPVVAPHLVTEKFIDAMRATAKTVIVAVHANHPRELTPEARSCLVRLADRGIALVSQTVLLRGVNDDVETLRDLMRAFVELRIKPYYLHHADMAPGTAHFRTSIAAGQQLISELRQSLSGLAMPTYVLDVPGGYGKVPVGPAYLAEDGHVVDPRGGRHSYSSDTSQ